MTSKKPKAVLAERLYVFADDVTSEMTSRFTYTIQDDRELEPALVATYREFGNIIGFARGDIGKIREVFTGFSIDDTRAVVPFEYPLKFVSTLLPDQERLIREWITNDYGMIKAPPRYGKSITGIALLCKLKQKTLILAHERSLLEQWEKELRKHTNVEELEATSEKKLVGIFDKHEEVFPLVTLSTYQKFITPRGRKRLKLLKNDFGTIIIDEAHLASAKCYSMVVSEFNSYYRIPITATDKRKNRLHVLVSDIAGPVVVEGWKDQLQVKVTYVNTGHKVNKFGLWTTFISRLASNIARNELIARYVVKDVHNGRSVLVTTDRRKHIFALKEFILELDPFLQIDVVTGNTFDREGIKQRAQSGDTQVVVAMNKIVQLGWNIPRWDTFHNTIPMANEPNWYQRVSRIRTPFFRCTKCKWSDSVPKFVGDSMQCPLCFSAVESAKKSPLVRDYLDSGHAAVFATQAIRERVAKKYGWNLETIAAPSKKISPFSTSRVKSFDVVRKMADIDNNTYTTI